MTLSVWILSHPGFSYPSVDLVQLYSNSLQEWPGTLVLDVM